MLRKGDVRGCGDIGDVVCKLSSWSIDDVDSGRPPSNFFFFLRLKRVSGCKELNFFMWAGVWRLRGVGKPLSTVGREFL